VNASDVSPASLQADISVFIVYLTALAGRHTILYWTKVCGAGNVDQQAILIKQLQEQHYHQYMQQLYRQQAVKL